MITPAEQYNRNEKTMVYLDGVNVDYKSISINHETIVCAKHTGFSNALAITLVLMDDTVIEDDGARVKVITTRNEDSDV